MKQLTMLPLLLLILSNVFAQQPNRYDVVITEIMADPAPQLGLPANEWIEIRNVSAQSFNLQGWKLSDAVSSSGAMPNFTLKPDSFVIICTGSAQAAMSVFGTTITVTGFPSLDNDGDLLTISSAQVKTIHSVRYDISWHHDELKKAGGWTLEMIDTKNPCSGYSNWKSSINITGGTPGKKNSIEAVNIDQSAPVLLRAYATDSVNLILVFDEPLDSARAAIAINYTISDGIGVPQAVIPITPVLEKVNLQLATALQRNKVYTITVRLITDCVGNSITTNSTRVGISSLPSNFDVAINEVLFNPRPNGIDYVELYNRGNKIIDLKQLYLANRNSTGIVSSIQQLGLESSLLFPNEYIVATEDPELLKTQYFVANTNSLIKLPAMPSYSDANGNVVLLNSQGDIVDELNYDEKWHFKLINNPEGVALEKIDPSAFTQNAENWHSAATSAGYGTPTYKNSQYIGMAQVKGMISVAPEIISPDNDGMDDFATLSYEFPEPGYVANISIFDAAGRSVRRLQQNALCGLKGYYRWDGLGELNQRLPAGIYIVYTELFNLNGKTRKFKQPIVLVRRT